MKFPHTRQKQNFPKKESLRTSAPTNFIEMTGKAQAPTGETFPDGFSVLTEAAQSRGKLCTDGRKSVWGGVSSSPLPACPAFQLFPQILFRSFSRFSTSLPSWTMGARVVDQEQARTQGLLEA